jgi:electron transport complex protein RnfC
MAFSLHGIHIPHRKNTQNKPVVYMDPPTLVTIPMSMHIGAPATPTVKVGDTVKVGTKIGEAAGNVSVPVYASVSGTVKKITELPLYNGGMTPAVVIESDGLMTPDETLTPPTVTCREELIEAIRQNGTVGLGGAGFPTHVKLSADPERIKYLIINGAECEPYVTSDSVTMVERRDDMAYALNAFKKYLGIRSVIIGVESNKKKAVSSMMRLMKENAEGCRITVKVLPAVYPQGGEKVLIYHTTGRIVPAGKLPIDVGCVVLNCTTLASIGAYLQTGMPLVRKCVTVDGGAVKDPQNVIVPIGTPIEKVLEFCGGLHCPPAKILYGGPMMGITVPDASLPIMKNTNAVLALTAQETARPVMTSCIRCGSCTNACPFGLAPADIARAYHNKDAALLEKLAVSTCMECGCCSFVCPANRPLVQTNKLSKAFLKESKEKERK